MALVKNLEKTALQTNMVHGEVNCTYSSFTSEDGTQYFQIDTYGSSDRKLKGKKSQTIQFDEKTAAELISILRHELSIA